MKKILGAAVIALAVVADVAPAQSLLTSSFGGTQATNFVGACQSGYCFSTGPVAVGSNGYSVTYTATKSGEPGPLLYGPAADLPYGLADNGFWRGVAYAATNGADAIVLSFSAPVSMFGAIMNYAPGYGGSPLLRAYDSGNNLIANYDLSLNGGGISTPFALDQGAFRGVAYAGGIAKIELMGGFAITQDIYVSSAVPEPGSVVLLAAGLAGLVGVARRRRSV